MKFIKINEFPYIIIRCKYFAYVRSKVDSLDTTSRMNKTKFTLVEREIGDKPDDLYKILEKSNLCEALEEMVEKIGDVAQG